MTEEELVRQICLKHAKKTGKNQGWQLYRLSRHHESRPPNSEPTTHEAFGVTVRVTPAVKIVFMVSAVCVVCDQVIWSGQEIHGLRVELETIVRREGHEDMTMREGGELARFHATQCLLKWWSEQE